jgi:hypothetical protein
MPESGASSCSEFGLFIKVGDERLSAPYQGTAVISWLDERSEFWTLWRLSLPESRANDARFTLLALRARRRGSELPALPACAGWELRWVPRAASQRRSKASGGR